ncbi:MAG: hypothetical protein GY845_14300 [Planctomycetes bacterium]|jgi:hypothetical protein|nr:hypothetical protein [Chloroflexota bacterium]MCP4609875.1 hypothetical protein [Planctomycetota bacterium]
MVPKTVAISEESTLEIQSQEQCVHHWIIDPPDGPISKGTCKLCGDEKDFPNDLSYSWKEEEKS